MIDWFQVFQKNGYFYIYDKKEKEAKSKATHIVLILTMEYASKFWDFLRLFDCLKISGEKLPLLVLSWSTEYGIGHKKGVTFWGMLHFPCTPVVALHHIRLVLIKLHFDLIVITNVKIKGSHVLSMQSWARHLIFTSVKTCFDGTYTKKVPPNTQDNSEREKLRLGS